MTHEADLRNHWMNGEYIPSSTDGESMSSCRLLCQTGQVLSPELQHSSSVALFLRIRIMHIRTALLEDRPL